MNYNNIEQSCIDFAKNPVTDGIEWKDVTSYSINDKKRIPTEFFTKIGICRILIVKDISYGENAWCCYSNELRLNAEYIDRNIPAEQAAIMAIAMCRDKVVALYKAFSAKLLEK